MNNRAKQIWENHMVKLKQKELPVAFLEFYVERYKAQKRINEARDKINKLLGKETI